MSKQPDSASLRQHKIGPRCERLAASFAMISLLFFLFVTVAMVLGWSQAIDKAGLLALRTSGDLAVPLGPSGLQIIMVRLSALGFYPILILITAIAATSMWLLGFWRMGFLFATYVLTGFGAAQGLKHVFLRARPDLVPHLEPVTSASYPSSHAMMSMIVYLGLALMASAQISAQISTWMKRCSAQLGFVAMALALSFLIGMTRLYIGVHWPTDILAGWSFGIFWAALWFWGAARFSR